MQTKSSKLIALAILLSILFTGGCIDDASTSDNSNETADNVVMLSSKEVTIAKLEGEEMSFGQHYHLEPLDVELQAAQYELPLDTRDIVNYEEFVSSIPLDEDAIEKLQKNGFVVMENPFYPREEIITDMYGTLEDKEIPVFITSDSLLHLYHIQFDETLKRIEEKEFYNTIWELDYKLLQKSIKDYETSTGDTKEAARRNMAYFAVALSLLEPDEGQVAIDDEQAFLSEESKFTPEEAEIYTFEVPEIVKNDVEAELALIESHEGFALSPIFSYKEDYSQYVPRGHYTYSEKLKNYFKAFMWHGRMSMLLKGDLIESADPEHDARIQTLSASLIASHLEKDVQLMESWERIYSVTAFYVGFSDDLGPYEYIKTLNSVMGGSRNIEELDIEALKAELATYRSPEIYGGTGAIEINVADPEELDIALEDTKGFRFMGQRFIPDSYMFQNLVYPAVDDRFMPKSLDVMALLGSEKAYEYLEVQGDTSKPGYTEQYEILETEFNDFNDSDWTRNLYWSWLYALQPLMKDYGTGYPTFMQTEAWQDKQLTASMASWTELRHDTILYAKQSYAFRASIFKPEEKEVVGYVEPVPEFYNRLLALTRMTNNGLGEMDVIETYSTNRLENLEQVLEKLVEISEKELQNEELSDEDYDFIESFGEELEDVIGGVEKENQKTTIVADVHTDINSGNVLEEGVGYVDMIVVAYKLPDGRIIIGAGPVMTHYEFEQPMSERLTDEAWREMLESSLPSKAEFSGSFSV
ncbi:DUF3160 domain-containing protein [Methanolobus sp. ZRKC2]|uniref:DUF3160 domain-containing protein n=1 Tax=Methanolobus sp. ZRKC2 TaxID=3125783 RepID=UPI00324D21CB